MKFTLYIIFMIYLSNINKHITNYNTLRIWKKYQLGNISLNILYFLIWSFADIVRNFESNVRNPGSAVVSSQCWNRCRNGSSFAYNKQTSHRSVFCSNFSSCCSYLPSRSVFTTVSSHPTTSTPSRSALRAVKHSKMSLEVALLDALDGVTFPKHDELYSQTMLACSSLSVACGASHIF